jgi:hypothetical protein
MGAVGWSCLSAIQFHQTALPHYQGFFLWSPTHNAKKQAKNSHRHRSFLIVEKVRRSVEAGTPEEFLVHVRPLGVIFRAKMRDELKKAGLYSQVDHQGWTKEWVVHSEPVGSSEQALKYLAPYIFRVAIATTES